MAIQRKRLLGAYDYFFIECRDIFIAKNKDYNKDEDPLSGFRDFGAFGILVRLGDKFSRLKNLYQRGGVAAVVTETLKDTLQDICNYCFLMWAIMEDESNGLINKPLDHVEDDELVFDDDTPVKKKRTTLHLPLDQGDIDNARTIL